MIVQRKNITNCKMISIKNKLQWLWNYWRCFFECFWMNIIRTRIFLDEYHQDQEIYVFFFRQCFMIDHSSFLNIQVKSGSLATNFGKTIQVLLLSKSCFPPLQPLFNQRSCYVRSWLCFTFFLIFPFLTCFESTHTFYAALNFC